MSRHLPTVIIAVTIWSYWLGVAFMMFRARTVHRKAAGLKPQQSIERLIWPMWTAVIIGWNVLPCLPWTVTFWPFALPAMAYDPPLSWIRLGLSLLGPVCLLLTIQCWRTMGKSWSVAVVEGEKTELITTGIYQRVRHPIYGLSILLMIVTALVAPSPAMILIAVIHVTFMMVKAANEERELVKVHGESYRVFQAATGRFFPKLG